MDPAHLSPSGNEAFLFVSTTAIGDALLGTPAIRAVRETFPRSRVDLVIKKANVDLFSGNPHVDRIYFFRGNWLRKTILRSQLAANRYAAAFVLHDNGEMIPLLSRLNIGNILYYQDFGEESGSFQRIAGPSQHALLRKLELVKAVGAETSSKRMVLNPTDDHARQAEEFIRLAGFEKGRPLAGIHPGARNIYKMWPASRFAQVVDWLHENTDCEIYISGSREDMELRQKIVGSSRRRRHVPLTAGSQGMLAALIQKSALFLSNDTGPMHMAFALDTPTVALFAPTFSQHLGPLENAARHVLIQKPQTCDPCISKRCLEPVCMEQIAVGEVLEAVESLLKSGLARKA